MKEKEEERGAGEKEKRIMKTRKKNDKRKKDRNKKNNKNQKENKKKKMEEKKNQLALRYLTWRQSLPKTCRVAGGIVVCIWLPQETDHVAKMFLD
jgi:hypothetical protein